ncbi:ly6/PLAUR domain-containing protein 6B-like isoform X1 [Carassius carassius]|uniref:ly6/PLAUR domain-containing protein 6B-like isoform X1 n=2 Tax=Carassius carassius TaxID=217509 RepID=UPI0028693A74|nr:ly6/PLAUR domain-containing protein 6B-like isoform X1 [Carassius carassius]
MARRSQLLLTDPHGVNISVLNMAADLALVSVLIQLLVDLVQSDSIDFYNIMPAAEVFMSCTATPYPKSFKCFTCEQASDNYRCNRWAEDVWCPQNTQYCMTIHHFNHHGKTTFVTKRCAVHEECQLAGCKHHKNTHHECISCCEGMVCNVELPTNHSNAVFAERQTQSSAAPIFRIWDSVILMVPVLTGLLPL